MSKVIVAMSGGVDSSVTAAILKEEGYDVVGVTMQLRPSEEEMPGARRVGNCCGADAIADARGVAHELGIPHYVMNFRDIFAQKVIDNFCSEYLMGRTPNPCIRCNRYIKFEYLLRRASELGAECMATGHYARIESRGAEFVLRKGVDSTKDQSYALYTLTQQQLRRVRMPLGKLRKNQVREIAHSLGLRVSQKEESQEICFVPDNNYAQFIENHMPYSSKLGHIVDQEGNVLGQHCGIIHYTIGQRRGLGIAAKEPLYVTAVDSVNNTVTVGSNKDIYNKKFVATDVNWIAEAIPSSPFAAKAKIRYLHEEAAAEIIPLCNGNVHVRFEQPQMAITPGQAVVFYDGDLVLGGGTIHQIGSESHP